MPDVNPSIDFSKLTPIEFMFGKDFEETQQLAALFEEAELYLSSFAWCRGVRKAYFGLGVADFIGIFLFELMPSEDSRDRFLWVVAGDVPPAYLAAESYPNSAFALQGYIQRMKSELASADCNAAQQRELMRRIMLLDSEVLPFKAGIADQVWLHFRPQAS